MIGLQEFLTNVTGDANSSVGLCTTGSEFFTVVFASALTFVKHMPNLSGRRVRHTSVVPVHSLTARSRFLPRFPFSKDSP